jgi:hypothetical protein
MTNQKGHRRKQLAPNRCNILAFASRDQKTTEQIAVVTIILIHICEEIITEVQILCQICWMYLKVLHYHYTCNC